MKTRWHRLIFPLLLTICLLLPATLLAAAAPPAPNSANALSATPLSVAGVVGREAEAEGEPWPYIIRLAGEPLATYQGGIPKLQATNPRLLGQSKLDVDSRASQAYLDHLEERQTQFIGQLQQVVGHPVEILYAYKVAYHGISAVLTPAEAARVQRMPGVVSVHRSEMKQLLTDVTPDFIGATSIWNGTAAGVDVGTRGEGVVVGIIDSGIWPEHPSFADDGTYPSPDRWHGTCQQPADDTAGYTCSNKLIGVQYYLHAYVREKGKYDGLFLSGRDDNGHGTHVASTAAGNENVNVTLLGLNRGTISGIAPRAHVAMYKACGPSGCATSDLVAAIDRAVADGVDVINYSIGGEAIGPWGDPDSLAFLAAREAGVFVATAAGNAGPGSESIGSPANAPWLTAVGASTSNRRFITEITLTGPGEPPANLWGASITDGVTAFNLVDAEGIPDSDGNTTGWCTNPFPEDTFQPGDAVLCKMAPPDPLELPVPPVKMGENVAAGGAGGVITWPVDHAIVSNYVIPAAHVESDVGQAIKDYIAAYPGQVTISFTPGTPVLGPDDPRVTADVMAAFSSRGPTWHVPSVIKPDVTAPGVQIMAGNTPQCIDPVFQACGASGQLFQAIQGTSMSSPHVAGAAALLEALHPDWSPAMIQSALMTTAKIEVLKEDGETPATPFDMGAGRIDLTRAADPGLVFDVMYEDYLAGQTDPANMNLPSLGFDRVFGVGTITRTATSVLDADSTWTVSVDAPEGVEIAVSPTPLEVPGHGTATFQVSVDTTAIEVGSHFAHLSLEHGAHRVHMPMAFESMSVATTSRNVDLIGQMGGQTNAVAVEGSYAYIGVGPRLMVLDVSDPASPTPVGQSAVLPDIVWGIHVAGRHAYVAAGDGGLRVVDVSDPASPVEVGSFAAREGIYDVYVAGRYAYVTAGRAGLRIVDVSDPTTPVEVGAYNLHSYAGDIHVASRYAYVIEAVFGGFHVVDVSNPSGPKRVAAYPMRQAIGLYMAGNYLYVAAKLGGLRIVDISDPAAAVWVSTYDTPGWAGEVYVAGTYAYVADREAGLRVIDVSDPNAPVEVGAYDTPGSAGQVDVAGTHAYVADGGAGLRVIDVSDPTTPAEVGAYQTLSSAWGVHVPDAPPAAGYAYVAGGDLWVVDISDPAKPVGVSAYDTAGSARDVTVVGNHAFVADGGFAAGESGLRVIDVSDPTAPAQVGSYDLSEGAADVHVVNSYAYVAANDAGLRVIDVSDPTAPVEAGFFVTPDSARGVYVAGRYAYVAADMAGLRVIDVSDPTAPVEVGFYDTPDSASAVFVSGSHAYVADSFSGLRVIDVSDPTAPVEVGAYDVPGFASDVHVAGSYTYIADGGDGLRVIDVSNPAAPAEVGFYDTPGGAYGVAVAGEYTYVASDEGSLFVLRFMPRRLYLPLVLRSYP